MHVATAETRAGVFLKTEHFALVARLLNLTSDVALGRAVGLNPMTISRAREGVIGEKFIAAVLSYFAGRAEELAKYGVGARFDDLFEIAPKQAAA
jgi:predicted secreted protein